jgi:penicillin-binding protein 1C
MQGRPSVQPDAAPRPALFRAGRMRRLLGGMAAGAFVLAACLAGAAALLDRAFPPDLSRLEAAGRVAVDRDGRTLSAFPAPGGVWRFATSADDVSSTFTDILVATEDRRFWTHYGVDPLSLLRAAVQDLRAGRVVSGGSTLTMQAARLLEPRPRTLCSKLIEMARALQLERRFSKREVLGVWLTLAPMGGNLEGIRAGSMAWFGLPSRNLEADQAALLVAIPRRPEALRPDRHPEHAKSLRDRVLLAATGGATLADTPRRRTAMPRFASLGLAGLVGTNPRTGGEPAVLATTLSQPLQAALERLAAERLAGLPEAASLAIVVADARTREILALTSGGPGPGEGRGGSLDLTRAIRSPGSALKPFIYAYAFQDGIAQPNSLLADLPRHFGGYAPENFDRNFTGSATAEEALRRSLNMPAVALLDRVGPLRFASSLAAAGVKLRLPPGADPSLPLALGGAGIDLRQLAGLYAAIATDGVYRPLRLLPSGPADEGRLVSAPSAAAVADILTQPFPLGGRRGVAWKTGTSWGGRDAWAMGFDQEHVAGVWVGRPDGTPLPGATGRDLALPLLSRVFDLLAPAPRESEAGFLPRTGATASGDAVRLLFPPPGAVITADGPVVLRAMGGRRPLAFLVDGVPLETDPARREAAWAPTEPGFYRVTVIDSAGTAAAAEVRLRH